MKKKINNPKLYVRYFHLLVLGLILVTSIVLLIIGVIQKNKTALVASAVTGLIFVGSLVLLGSLFLVNKVESGPFEKTYVTNQVS